MRGRRLLCLTGFALVLAACSDGGGTGPTVLPPLTDESTSSATTSSTPPTSASTAEPTPTTTYVLPDEHVPEIDQLVQEFFAAYNEAQDSRDFAAFDALYLPQCEGCIQMREELAGWLADGQTVEGGDWVILQQSSRQFSDGTGTLSVLGYRSQATVHDQTGTEILSVAATPVVLFGGSIAPLPPRRIVGIGYGEV